MSLLALVLVLTSAFLHAFWNLLAKRVSGGMVFVCLFSPFATLLYAPILVVMIVRAPIQLGVPELIALGGTCILHIAYYLLLNRGYRAGDLSLVYPLARGIGPVLATVGAIAFLSERPSPIALFGSLL